MMIKKFTSLCLLLLADNNNSVQAFVPPQTRVVITPTTTTSNTLLFIADTTTAPDKSSSETKKAETEQTIANTAVQEQQKDESDDDDKDNLMQQIKDAGTAGIISYILWEWAFWGVSVPVVLFGYQAATGHWPDLSSKEDIAKLSAEAFAFVNFARFAVPLRLGLALGTTPWVQENIVDRFIKKEDEKEQVMAVVEEEPPQVVNQVVVETEGMEDLTLRMEQDEAPQVTDEEEPKKKGFFRRLRSRLPFRRKANKD